MEGGSVVTRRPEAVSVSATLPARIHGRLIDMRRPWFHEADERDGLRQKDERCEGPTILGGPQPRFGYRRRSARPPRDGRSQWRRRLAPSTKSRPLLIPAARIPHTAGSSSGDRPCTTTTGPATRRAKHEVHRKVPSAQAHHLSCTLELAQTHTGEFLPRGRLAGPGGHDDVVHEECGTRAVSRETGGRSGVPTATGTSLILPSSGCQHDSAPFGCPRSR